MRLFVLILAAAPLFAQGNCIELKDQQPSPHYITICAPATITAPNRRVSFNGSGSIFLPGDIHFSADDMRLFNSGGNMGVIPSANGVGNHLVLYPTTGTLPTDTASEMVLYRKTLAQEGIGNIERLDFSAWITPCACWAIQGEAFGTGNFLTLILQPGPTENFRLLPDGTNYFGLGQPGQSDALILQPATILGTGQENSPNIIWTSEAFDTVIHAGQWRAYAESDSTAGASTWVLQWRHDADPYVDRLRIADDGGVKVTGDITPTTFPIALGTAAAHFASAYIDDGRFQSFTVYDSASLFGGTQFVFGMTGSHHLAITIPIYGTIFDFQGGVTPVLTLPDLKLSPLVSAGTQCVAANSSGLLVGTGSPCAGAAGGAAGADTNIQYNNGGVLAATSALAWNYTTHIMNITSALNSAVGPVVENTNSGSTAGAQYEAKNDAGKFGQFGIASSTSSYGALGNSYNYWYGNTNVIIMADGSGNKIHFAAEGNADIMQVRGTGLYPSTTGIELGAFGSSWATGAIDTLTSHIVGVTDGVFTSRLGIDGGGNLAITGPASVLIATFTGGVTPHITTPNITVGNLASGATQCVSADTAGHLTGAGAPCGAGGGGVVSLNTFTGAVTVASGNTNRVTVVSASNVISISGPQDIAVASSPTFSGLTLSSISGSTQCLQVNSSGVISGVGAACGTGGGSFLPLSGGTMSGNILGNGGTNIGSTSAYFNNGTFGGTVEGSALRGILGTPSSVSDFFQWLVPALHLFDLRNSSGSLMIRVDDTNHLNAFAGGLYPLSNNSFDLGLNSGSEWRNIYLGGSLISNGSTVIDNTRAGFFSGLSVTGGLSVAGAITGGSTITASSLIGAGIAFTAQGHAGTTVVLNVRDSAGTGSCTVTITGGIVTASTC